MGVLKAMTVLVAMMVTVCSASVALATPPRDEASQRPSSVRSLGGAGGVPLQAKERDEPNPVEHRRMRERLRLQERLEDAAGDGNRGLAARAMARSGTDRLLIILVEFAGTDMITWTRGVSTWDPVGRGDLSETVFDGQGNPVPGDCSRIITETRQFTYAGPLHNQIERPLTADDPSGSQIWTPDFDRGYYEDITFGNGVVLNYQRQDGSAVYESFMGMSVRDYYADASSGGYFIVGDVVGWVQVPHSMYWYGADTCPGRKSSDNRTGIRSHGAIPGAGSARTLVIDSLEAVRAAHPDFDWTSYDQDGDGFIDRLWIIHAGLGEEENVTLLNRTDYGEGALWSHSSRLSPAYEVVPEIAAGPYIMMPENSGMAVLAHEFGHNLGADDLYSYAGGRTSAGFWTLMADSWTGHPIGMQPGALDPWHLDGWGWLDPKVITDPSREHVMTIGQASRFPGGDGVYRAAKIRLPDGSVPLAVQPLGSFQWWGGREDYLNAMMTSREAIAIPAGGATLLLSLAFDLEEWYDYLWVQVSSDGGASWFTLTNGNTTCGHASSWIGSSNGFPEDLCAAGIGGFTGRGASFPEYATETFSLAPFAGSSVLLRLWYMTDSGTLGDGPFIDNVVVTAGGQMLLSDDAESGPHRWSYADGWDRYRDTRPYTHSFYLQWRNVSSSGGYDSALADPRWRYGPAATGLLVWYNNNLYADNELPYYLQDPPSFGPKGRMLVIDAHPQPYRDPAMVAAGFDNEGGNVYHRSQMRDAPLSLRATPDFSFEGTSYVGRPGVALFDDALGHYPGAEWVSAGPGYTPRRMQWVTGQWDASAVLPSRQPYGIRAPGYGPRDRLSYDCQAQQDGTLDCTTLASGLGYGGGTGNPGDVGGAFGWHVEILSESDSQATVRIYNTAQHCQLACEGLVPESAARGFPVQLAAQVNAANCGEPVLYEWEMGDGSPRSTAAAPSHTYWDEGRYSWKLLASSSGATCTATGRIQVSSVRLTPRVRRRLGP